MPIDLEEIGGENISFDELEVETIEVLSEDENETIDTIEEAIAIAGVRTVNGQTGDVILDAEDVNALPNDTSYGYGLSVDGRSVTLVNQNGDEISTIETQDTTYTAGTGIDITDNVISSTQTSAEWGNIDGNIDDQTDLKNALDNKVDKVTGKGLSTNDFTDFYQQKLESLENYDDTEIRGEISEVQGEVSTIEGKIPAQATSSNQLADKNFVNSSLNSITAFYITKDAQGTQFATKAELDATTTFYSGGEVRVPTRNDYCIVLADETQTDPVTGEKPTTRYIYQNGWEFQYIVNKTTLTAAQLAAVNSGATSALIGQITTNQNNITALDTSKQDKIHNFYELDFNEYGTVYGEDLADGTYICLNEGFISGYNGGTYYAYTGDIFTKGTFGIGLISNSGVYWLNFEASDWTNAFSPTYDEMNDSLDTKQNVLTAGTNITISGDTISAIDTTYSDFVGTDGSDDGSNGLVPAPTASDADKFLKSDGTWAEAGGSSLPIKVIPADVSEVVVNELEDGTYIVDSDYIYIYNYDGEGFSLQRGDLVYASLSMSYAIVFSAYDGPRFWQYYVAGDANDDYIATLNDVYAFDGKYEAKMEINHYPSNTIYILNTTDHTRTDLTLPATLITIARTTSVEVDNGRYELIFTSPATPTSFNYPNDILWSGDDLVNGKFVPQANKRYWVTFKWDSQFVVANVEGADYAS